MKDEHALAKFLNANRHIQGQTDKPSLISHDGWDHTTGEECAACDLVVEHLMLGPGDEGPGSAEAPMTHEQAMALLQALFQELEFGEDYGHHVNYSFVNALRVIHPDLPQNYKFAPYHTQRIQPGQGQNSRIDARNKIGAMIERWGKAIQDCVKEPKKENGHGGQE